MTDERDIERLVRAVTQAVLTRLGLEEPGQEGRRAWLLLPLPTGLVSGLSGLVHQLRDMGYGPRAVVSSRVADELERTGQRGRLGTVQRMEEADLGENLARLRPGDLLALASCGFSLGRELCALEDRNPWVHLVTQALRKGIPVSLVTDELLSTDGGLKAQGESLVRDLQHLGIRPVKLGDLPGWAHGLARGRSTLSRAAAGLLTEADVERLVADGEKQLELPRHVVVTPLAFSRAAELGLEIIKEDN